MPLYAYECMECGHTIEKIIKLEDYEKPVECSKCTDDTVVYMTRTMGAPAFKVNGMNAANGYSNQLADQPGYDPNTGYDQRNLE